MTCLDIFHSSLRETVHYYYDDKLKQIIQNPMEMIVDAFSKLGKLNRTAITTKHALALLTKNRLMRMKTLQGYSIEYSCRQPS